MDQRKSVRRTKSTSGASHNQKRAIGCEKIETELGKQYSCISVLYPHVFSLVRFVCRTLAEILLWAIPSGFVAARGSYEIITLYFGGDMAMPFILTALQRFVFAIPITSSIFLSQDEI